MNKCGDVNGGQLEKARLLLQVKEQEVDSLKSENALLKDMLALLKSQGNLPD